MKGCVFILYKLRNYEVVTKRVRDGKTDYSASVFNVGVPVSDKNRENLWNEFDNKANQYLQMWYEQLSKNKEYSYETYISGATSQIMPYGVSPKDIYWSCYVNKYSNSWIKNYLKYRECLKQHKDSLIYFSEHVENNFYMSSATEEELIELNKGRDELVALCHTDNCTFIMSEINKGLLFAIKKDIRRLFI